MGYSSKSLSDKSAESNVDYGVSVQEFSQRRAILASGLENIPLLFGKSVELLPS